MPPILDPSAYGFGNARVISLDLSPLHAQKSSGSRMQFCEQSLEIAHACSGCDALRPRLLIWPSCPKRGHFNDRYSGTMVNFRDPSTSPVGS